VTHEKERRELSDTVSKLEAGAKREMERHKEQLSLLDKKHAADVLKSNAAHRMQAERELAALHKQQITQLKVAHQEHLNEVRAHLQNQPILDETRSNSNLTHYAQVLTSSSSEASAQIAKLETTLANAKAEHSEVLQLVRKQHEAKIEQINAAHDHQVHVFETKLGTSKEKHETQ
jgi:hypothetical protein